VERDRIEKVVREVLADASSAEGVSSARADARSTRGELLIALGADHGGFALKESLKRYMTEELGYRVKDVGTYSTEPCDYPDFAKRVAEAVASGECFRGIMIDGAGIGSSMAANRVPGILAACCHDVRTVVNSREHNNANVLTMGSGIVGRGLARQMVRIWLATNFAGGRHERRVRKILDMERSWTEKSSSSG
jgi:ribose 5-phosphate isomerase B